MTNAQRRRHRVLDGRAASEVGCPKHDPTGYRVIMATRWHRANAPRRDGKVRKDPAAQGTSSWPAVGRARARREHARRMVL